MKTQFYKIIEDVLELFSWYKEIGVQYFDLSEKSLKIISSLGDDTSNNISTSTQNKYRKIATTFHTQTDPIINFATKPHSQIPSTINPVTKSHPLTKPIANYVNFQGNKDSQIFFLSDSFSYRDPVGELFINILKAMNLRVDTICLCTFHPLNYRIGIPKLRQQLNNISEMVDNGINDIKVRTNGFYPKIICSLGDSALKILMGIDYMLTSSRGRFHNYHGIHLMPTYHPSHILNDKNLKRLVWEDMKQIMGIMI